MFPRLVHFHVNQTHFHMKDFARRFVLEQRHERTQKLRIKFVGHSPQSVLLSMSNNLVPRAFASLGGCLSNHRRDETHLNSCLAEIAVISDQLNFVCFERNTRAQKFPPKYGNLKKPNLNCDQTFYFCC